VFLCDYSRAFFNALFGSDAPDMVVLGSFDHTQRLLWWPAVTSPCNASLLSEARAVNFMDCNTDSNSTSDGGDKEVAQVDEEGRNCTFKTDDIGDCRARPLCVSAEAAVQAKSSPLAAGHKNKVVALLTLRPPSAITTESSSSSSSPSEPLPSLPGCALAIVTSSGRVRVLAPALRVSAPITSIASPMATVGSSTDNSGASAAAVAYPAALGFADFTLRGVSGVVCAVSVPGAIVHCDGRGTVYVTPLFDTDSSTSSSSSSSSTSSTSSRLVPTPGFASALPLPPGTCALTVVESIDTYGDSRSSSSSHNDSGWLVMLRRSGAVCAVPMHQLAHAAALAFEDDVDGESEQCEGSPRKQYVQGKDLNSNGQISSDDEVDFEEEENENNIDETCNQRMRPHGGSGNTSGHLQWASKVGSTSGLQFKPASLREPGRGAAAIQLNKRLVGLRAATSSANSARYHRLEATFALAKMANTAEFCSRCARAREASNIGSASSGSNGIHGIGASIKSAWLNGQPMSSTFLCSGFKHAVQLVTNTESGSCPTPNQNSRGIIDDGFWVGESGHERTWSPCDAATIQVELAADNATAQLLSGGGWSYSLSVSLDDCIQDFNDSEMRARSEDSTRDDRHGHFLATEGEDETPKKWARGGEESRRSLVLPLANVPWQHILPSDHNSNSSDATLCSSWTTRVPVPHFPSGPSGAARPIRLSFALLYAPSSVDSSSSSSLGSSSSSGDNNGAAVDLGALCVSSLALNPKPPPQTNVDVYPAGLRRATAALRARPHAPFGVAAVAAAAASNAAASASGGGSNNHGSSVGGGGSSSGAPSSSWWLGPPPLPSSWGGPRERGIAEGPSPHSIPVHTFTQRTQLRQPPGGAFGLPGNGSDGTVLAATAAATTAESSSIDDVDESLRRVVAALGTSNMSSARWGGSYGRGAQGNNMNSRSRLPPAAAIRPGPQDLATLHTRQTVSPSSLTTAVASGATGSEVVVQCTSRALLASLHANILDAAATTATSARVEYCGTPYGAHGTSYAAHASDAWEASKCAEISAVVDGIRQQLRLAHFQAAQRAAQRQAALAATRREAEGLVGLDDSPGRDEALRRASLDLLDLYHSLRDETGKGVAVLL